MTETEWLASEDPVRMLHALTNTNGYRLEGPSSKWLQWLPPVKVSDRKLRLFACACCRHPGVWALLSRGSRNLVAAAEQAIEGATDDLDRDDWEDLCVIGWNQSNETMPKALQAALLRDIVGNPFRRHVVLPRDIGEVLDVGAKNYRQRDVILQEWITPTVLSLATAAYEERQPDGTLDPFRLLVLRDGLLDAGCECAELLAHLAGAGPHVKGCWALDLILGKE